MTFEEKRATIREHCFLSDCIDCLIKPECIACHGNFTDNVEMCEAAYSKIKSCEGTEPKDMVNHPSHYAREGAMECIDEMLLIFGKEAVKGFCLCNAWKYRERCLFKNGEEDLKKSDWYIRKYKELCDGTEDI